MKVNIVDAGFTKHDKNPSHVSAFTKEWTLLTWGCDDLGMLKVIASTQSSYSNKGTAIEPMDICTIVPVCALKHSRHSAGYGAVHLNLQSPLIMCQNWEFNPPNKADDALNVTVSHELGNKKKLRSPSAKGKKSSKANASQGEK